MACVLALASIGFFGWFATLRLAITLMLGLLALIAYFGGGSDGLGVWPVAQEGPFHRPMNSR
jgi:hypothetical protein